MFPYYFNNNTGPVPLTPALIGRDTEKLRNLPEEVKESLEQHKNEFRDEGDIRAFLSRLDMKK